jgi:hypothetical protein
MVTTALIQPASFFRPSLSLVIDASLIERSQRTSKRYANGTLKHDTNTDVPDGLSHLPPPSLSNQTSSTPNGTHQKKNKTSHAQEKPAFIKHEPPTHSSTSTKNESNSSCNINSSTETDSKVRPTLVATTTTTTTTTVNSLIAIPPKKETTATNNNHQWFIRRQFHQQ